MDPTPDRLERVVGAGIQYWNTGTAGSCLYCGPLRRHSLDLFLGGTVGIRNGPLRTCRELADHSVMNVPVGETRDGPLRTHL
ncbi:hypothetical protein T440DRAFT_469518 [Plenodomus tracheiphilus IPT5]|uniref:Uncharacterized protein n=1 Tax=Plenodomus tracheiphilus IPT5 TaxID=1408161 RepID=A0A6A7B1B8_9PLEO|nr:hypothetical protein T440DRAFT_469518 [Plenodomus tracheiphilus IPT5]